MLLAVFGPEYQCLWASVGMNGRSPDSAIWQKSDLKAALSSVENHLSIPPPKALPGRSKPLPYVLTGDDAFALTRFLMKPFPHSGLSVEHAKDIRKWVWYNGKQVEGYLEHQYSFPLTQLLAWSWQHWYFAII